MTTALDNKGYNKPDHYLKSLQDSVFFIGELEHTRRHALRSLHSVGQQLLDRPDDDGLSEKVVRYGVVATKCQEIRRAFMEQKFSKVDDEDWCLLKSTASLQQLAYELFPENNALNEVDRLVDTVWTGALGVDMSGCKSCKEDRENGNA